MKITVLKIKAFLLAVLLLSCASSVLGAEDASEYVGVYASDLVWSGTVTMTGDVLVLKGASLTIRAGTQVNVVPAESTKIDPEYLSSQTELLVRGRIDIQGTADKPVRFVVVDPDDQEYAWAGITLDGATDSRIEHVEITHADVAIRCVGSSPDIEGSLISHCRYGIITQQQSQPKIIGNTLRYGEGGIYCWRGSNPYLLDNSITGHDEEAVFVDEDSRPWLDRNTISGNAIGLAIYPRDLPYDPVEVVGNTEDIRWLGNQGQGVDQ